MKALWVVNKDSGLSYTGQPMEYRVGWWDETQGAWMLNDEFGARLLALLTSLGWGDAKNGQIPNLEILTRPLATLEVQAACVSDRCRPDGARPATGAVSGPARCGGV